MFWLKQNQKRPPKEMRVLDLCFIGEQDGPPERVLKERLIDFFKRDQSVQQAYLAKVNFGHNNPISVALCLRTQFGTDKGMVEKVGTIFASVFGAKEHLDIVFLDDNQEASLVKVCQPFFVN
jgi:hypothetical protein